MCEVEVVEVIAARWSDSMQRPHHAEPDDRSAGARVWLRERSGARGLDLFVGAAEASALRLALEGVQMPRPMTHDLYAQTLDVLRAELAEARIVDVRDGVFMAELELTTADGTSTISARPSDAINIALRRGRPIYVADHLLHER